ncbi:hypothetical protein AMJ97_CH01088 [Rhizobium sp. N1314]|nr:hypothetical protein AMK02_CH01088 [Rhizobium sp. N731]ANL14970.1 hypothetical protein AMJ97_CH01088 [Rhizobium sp. N1314]
MTEVRVRLLPYSPLASRKQDVGGWGRLGMGSFRNAPMWQQSPPHPPSSQGLTLGSTPTSNSGHGSQTQGLG